MKAHIEGIAHFIDAFPPAGLTFPVDQDTSRAIEHAEEGNLCHFDFCEGLIAAGDAGVGDGYVDEGVVVTGDDIGLAGCEFFAAADAEGAAGEGEEDAHPDAGEGGEVFCFLRVGAEIAEHQKGDHDDEHRDEEQEDGPDGPDAAEDRPDDPGAFGGLVPRIFGGLVSGSFGGTASGAGCVGGGMVTAIHAAAIYFFIVPSRSDRCLC